MLCVFVGLCGDCWFFYGVGGCGGGCVFVVVGGWYGVGGGWDGVFL